MKVFQLVFVLLALLSSASCSDYSDGAQDNSATATMHIKFTISVGGQSQSRAGTWGDNDYNATAANEWESTIEAGRLQALVFDVSDKYLGQVSNLIYYRHTDNSGNVSGNIYDIIGSLNIPLSSIGSDGKLECKLMVFANYGQLIPSQILEAALADIGGENDVNIKYWYDAAGIAARTAYIPMWGVKTYTGINALTLKKGQQADAGEIFLLRAMSKIRVSLYKEMTKSHTLTGAMLTNYNNRGYIVPASYAFIGDTKSLNYRADGTVPLSYNPVASKSNTSLAFIEETVGTSYVIYVPEYETTTDDTGTETTPHITLTITDKSGNDITHDFVIQLKKYTNGVAGAVQKLTRNTVYNYTIMGAKSVKYQAVDWTTGLGGEIDIY